MNQLCFWNILFIHESVWSNFILLCSFVVITSSRLSLINMTYSNLFYFIFVLQFCRNHLISEIQKWICQFDKFRYCWPIHKKFNTIMGFTFLSRSPQKPLYAKISTMDADLEKIVIEVLFHFRYQISSITCKRCCKVEKKLCTIAQVYTIFISYFQNWYLYSTITNNCLLRTYKHQKFCNMPWILSYHKCDSFYKLKHALKHILQISFKIFNNLQPTWTGRHLYEAACRIIGLREIWFFGLQFTNKKQLPCWLQMDKQVQRLNCIFEPWFFQIRKQDISRGEDGSLQFLFLVKFYPEDVETELIQDLTRHLFFLQIKQVWGLTRYKETSLPINDIYDWSLLKSLYRTLNFIAIFRPSYPWNSTAPLKLPYYLLLTLLKLWYIKMYFIDQVSRPKFSTVITTKKPNSWN